MKNRNLRNNTVPTTVIGGLLLSVLLLFSCPSTIDTAMATLAEDEMAPQITLSPLEGNYYRSSVTINGSIVDYIDERNIATGGIKGDTLIWGILNKSAEKYNGTFSLNDDGSFSFTIADTSELSETIVVRVEATDLSANTGYSEITLEPYTQGPYIVISSPSDNEEWSNEYTKTVTGYVRNSTTDETFDEVDFSSLTVTVNSSENSTANPGNLVCDRESADFDGAFSFSFSTYDLASRQPITISISDKNGNSSQKTIYIVAASAGPYIEITSPDEQSIYNRDVTVNGYIASSSTAGSGMEGVTDLSVSLLGTGLGNNTCTFTLNPSTGEFTPNTFPDGYNLTFDWESDSGNGDGSFSYTFDTEGKQNDLIVQVTAGNINGQQTILPLTLRDDNEGPYITITSPRDYDVYGSSIAVEGSIKNNSNDSSQDEVESLSWSVANSTIIGGNVTYSTTDGSFSFDIAVPGDQSGRVTIEITAEDINGNQTSKYILLQDNQNGPEITVDSPANYSYFGSGSNLLNVTGTIRNSDGIEGSGETTSASWTLVGVGSITAPKETITMNSTDDSFDFNVDTTGITESTITLRLSATGEDEHITISDIVLTNDNTPPVLAFTSPTPAEMDYYDSTISFTGTFRDGNNTTAVLDDISELSWSLPGTLQEGAWDVSTLTEGTFTVNDIDASLFTGSVTIRVTAEDNNGNISTITRTLQDDREGPTITVTSPANNSFFGNGANLVTVEGTILNSDNAPDSGSSITEAEWAVIGSQSSSDFGDITVAADGSFTFYLDTSGITDSSFIIRLSAVGAEGHSNSRDLVLNNDGQAPLVSFTTPNEMDYYYGTINFSGTYTDADPTEEEIDDILSVSWDFPGAEIPGEGYITPVDGTFSQSFDSSTLSGNQSIRVTVTDKNGNSTTATRIIQGSNEGPKITISTPQPDSDFGSGDNQVTFSGTILDAQNNPGTGTFAFSAEWEIAGSGSPTLWAPPPDGSFSFNVDTSTITDSSIIVRITATAINGNVSTEELTLLNDRAAPVITFTTPDEMSSYYNQISFSGSVLDADLIDSDVDLDTYDLSSVTWEILGEGTAQTLSYNGSGEFDMSGDSAIDSSGFSGNKVILITATDQNGNTATATRTLLEHADGPDLSIDTPSCYPYYARTFTVTGAVSHDGGLEQVNTTAGYLQYKFGTDDWQNFTISESTGVITPAISIDSTDKTGTQALLLRAVDLNGDETQEQLILLNDGIGVDMTVTTPESGSSFATVVPVEFSISDYQDLETLTWKLVEPDVSGSFTVPGTGSFSVDLDTSSYDYNLTLQITAEDIHANTTVEEIGLIYQGSSIPTFAVDSENSSVDLSWDAVPSAESYRVYYTTDGSSPITDAGSYPYGSTTRLAMATSYSESSPYSVTNLQNGDKHVFVLEAVMPSGFSSSFSEEITTVPLSPLSYCPTLAQEREDEILISWPDYSCDTGYTVWRSKDSGVSWQKISGDLSVNSYTDNNVDSGDLVYYRVKPVQYSDETSWYSAIEVHALSTALEYTSSLNTIQPLIGQMTEWDTTTGETTSSWMAARTAASGGATPKIEVYNVSNIASVSKSGEYSLSTDEEKAYCSGMAAEEDYVFFVTDDTGTDGDQLHILDVNDKTSITTHAIATLDISKDSDVGQNITGITVWYGDDADTPDTAEEWWVFLSDSNDGLYVVKVTETTASVVNLIQAPNAPATEDWKVAGPVMIYENGSQDDLTLFDFGNNHLQTLEDISANNLSTMTSGDFSATDISGQISFSPSTYNYTATDGSNFFFATGTNLFAVNKDTPTESILMQTFANPAFLSCLNNQLYIGASNLFLASYDIATINYSETSLSESQTWSLLPQRCIANNGVLILAEMWGRQIETINVNADSLTLSHHVSITGTYKEEMNLEQSTLFGNTLYTYNNEDGANLGESLLRWDLSDPTTLDVPTDRYDISNLSGGLFAVEDRCFNTRSNLHVVDYSPLPDTAVITDDYYPNSSSDAGQLNTSTSFETATRFGHYLFIGGNSSKLTPRTLGVLDIGALADNQLMLIDYAAVSTTNWMSTRRIGDYIIALTYSNPEMFIIDVSDWEDINVVNTIDLPDTGASSVQCEPSNEVEFIAYRDIVYMAYADNYNHDYNLAALPISELAEADWEDFININNYDSGAADSNSVQGVALCTSGEFLFAAYSTDSQNDIVAYKLDETLSQITMDATWSSTAIPRPIVGLHAVEKDGTLYLIQVKSNSSTTDYGGLDIIQVNENF